MTRAAVRLASAPDRPRAVCTVVAAFRTDPAFRYFFPDDATYEDDAGRFAGAVFDRRLAYGTVWVAAAEEGDGVASVAMWEPPVGGAPAAPPSVGLGPALSGTARDRMAAYDAAVHGLLPPQPYWYLGILATHPAYAGRRLGRSVMSPGVARGVADGVPCVLETTSQTNVALYERSGWSVVDRTAVETLSVWVMAAPG